MTDEYKKIVPGPYSLTSRETSEVMDQRVFILLVVISTINVKGQQIWCGGHYADYSCYNCVWIDGEEYGGNYCNGDCKWLSSEERCVPKGAALKPIGNQLIYICFHYILNLFYFRKKAGLCKY